MAGGEPEMDEGAHPGGGVPPQAESSFEDPARVLAGLSRSAFRSRFHLSPADVDYARSRGRDTVVAHAHDLLGQRIGPAHPHNDGKQTPMRGHPVFVAQHATATCCRGCVAKWHHIPQGRELTPAELDHLVDVVIAWIERELLANP